MGLPILFIVPFLGTLMGSASVFVFRSGIGEKTGKAITGFAAGVMIAASVWSLLLPAIDSSSYITAALGFLSGIVLLLALDLLVPHLHATSDKAEGKPSRLSRSALPHLHATSDKAEGKPSRLSRSALLMLSVTLHNIPEGMAVGAAAAATGSISYASALALSLGIALQNFPEGLVVSMPLYKEGKSRGRAFLEGTISGAVEPIGGILAFIFVSFFSSMLPFLLSLAAGAMFYVVVEELIPEASEGEHSNIGTIGAALGFAAMMVLDGIFG